LGISKVSASFVGTVKVTFAEFMLDSDARRLSRNGGEVRLSPKAFDLLRLLIERRPNVVDKSTLHTEIWPRTFVVDANLTVLIAEVRRALDDNAREPMFIRTVHALGYAFCGDAVNVGAPPVPKSASGGRCWLMWNERAIALVDGENLVGREPDCAVWLDASGVSRRHARVDVIRGGDEVRLQDLGSTNGTLLNGSPIQGVATVGNGDKILVGDVELTLRVWSRGESRETERIHRRNS
jgi:DNA-binding winged helix-turn-helix (wHTH) protein